MGETLSRPEARRQNSSTAVPTRQPPYGGWMQSLVGSGATTQCEDAAAPPPPPPLPSSTKSSRDSSGSGEAPPPPPPTAEKDSIEAASQAVSAFANPGPYEQAVSDGKRLVMLDTFDGFRCEINKQVSPFMAVIHSFHLGTTMIPDGRKSSYSFLTQVADEAGLLMTRVDPARGSVDGRIHKALLGGIGMAKLQIGVSQEGQGDQMMAEIDLGGMTWSGNLKYGSMGGGLVYGLNFMQAVTPKFSAGAEGLYIAANQNLLSSYACKYEWSARTNELDEKIVPAPKPGPPGMPPPDYAGKSVLVANYNAGQGAITLNYKRCVTPNRLTLGAELQFSPLSLDSQVLLGAEYKWQRSKLNLVVDGGGRIQSLLEAKYGMQPGSPTLQFSADVDHLKDEMKFGYGINIEG